MSSSKKAAFVRQNLNRSRVDANAEADRFVDIVNIGSDLDVVGSVNSFNLNLFASTGQSVGGIQDPPGHRNLYREIGVGVVLGTNSNDVITVGPFVLT